jgi:hypothetical protein
MKALVRPAVVGDCFELAPRLRADDVREIRAASGLSPLSALFESVRRSKHAYSCEDQSGRVFAMFGVADAPTDPTVGVIWMLASDDLFTHRKQFLRECRRWFKQFRTEYRVLWNSWLKWIGCTFVKRHPVYGKGKLPFMEFIYV